MRICLLGDFSGTPDEGMKNISKTVREYLSGRHTVMAASLHDLLHYRSLRQLREFAPEVIHYLHGPTIRSLAMLKLLKFLLAGIGSKIVVSATRPYFSKYSGWLIPMLAPDLVLTQSTRFEGFFKNHGWKARFVPNGVDTNKFAPVDAAEKQRLRGELGIPVDKTVILHVGHIKQNRQLGIFKAIQSLDFAQVVIVGGTVQKVDERLKDELVDAGVIVLHRYFEDVSVVYKAADLYVFPIMDIGEKFPDSYNEVGAIDLPLSVLEAMACNLPIITTRFGALERLFEQGGGFEYVQNATSILDRIKRLNNEGLSSQTRDKILPYDWQRVVELVEGEYAVLRK